MLCVGTVVLVSGIEVAMAKNNDSDFVFSNDSAFSFTQRSAKVPGLFYHPILILLTPVLTV